MFCQYFRVGAGKCQLVAKVTSALWRSGRSDRVASVVMQLPRFFPLLLLLGCAATPPPLDPVVLEEPGFDLASATRNFVVDAGMTEQGTRRQARRSTQAQHHMIDAGEVLLPECEAYLTHLTVCIEKLPADTRQSIRQAADEVREAWLAITDEHGKQAVRQACRDGAEAWADMPLCK
jgi:hypothetical protein